jgi:hypothetical protein
MEFSKGQHENWQSVQASLKGRDFFRPGPLMRALECERPCVLLIDELDKVDEGFEAQAFKRASSCFGLGRYLYNLQETWVPLDGQGKPTRVPVLPNWALPIANPAIGKANPACGPRPPVVQRGPIDQKTTARIEGFRSILGDPIYGEILWRIARTRQASAIPNAQLQASVAEAMERASRGVGKAHTLAEQISEAACIAIFDRLRIESMTAIPSLDQLKTLVTDLEREAARTAA